MHLVRPHTCVVYLCVYTYIYIYIYICKCLYTCIIYIYIHTHVLRRAGAHARLRQAADRHHDGSRRRRPEASPPPPPPENPMVAIFYPFSQFCEIDISLLSLQTQPNTAPNLFQRGVEYGKYESLEGKAPCNQGPLASRAVHRAFYLDQTDSSGDDVMQCNMIWCKPY